VTFVLVGRLLGLGAGDFIGQMWRPLAAAAAMFLTVRAIVSLLVDANQWMALAVSIVFGTLAYGCFLLVLWWLSGRPDSAERFLITMLQDRMYRSRQKSKNAEQEHES
jgi:hypothetical protein